MIFIFTLCKKLDRMLILNKKGESRFENAIHLFKFFKLRNNLEVVYELF